MRHARSAKERGGAGEADDDEEHVSRGDGEKEEKRNAKGSVQRTGAARQSRSIRGARC